MPRLVCALRNCALTWLCPDTIMTIYIIYIYIYILLIITSAIIILYIFNRKFKNTKYFSKNAAGDSCTVVKKTHFTLLRQQWLIMFLFTPFKLTHRYSCGDNNYNNYCPYVRGGHSHGHNYVWAQFVSEHILMGKNVVEPLGCNFHHKYLISISYNYIRPIPDITRFYNTKYIFRVFHWNQLF